MTNRPILIVNDKIFNMPDFTVGGVDMGAGDVQRAAQMRIIMSLGRFFQQTLLDKGVWRYSQSASIAAIPILRALVVLM